MNPNVGKVSDAVDHPAQKAILITSCYDRPGQDERLHVGPQSQDSDTGCRSILS